MKDMSFAVASYAQDGNMLYFSSQDRLSVSVALAIMELSI